MCGGGGGGVSCQILRELMSACDKLYIWNHIVCEVLSICDKILFVFKLCVCMRVNNIDIMSTFRFLCNGI